MSPEDPREREDLCGEWLVAERSGENLAEEFDPDTWYEAEDGIHYCCREVWEEIETDRCIWHADMAAKPAGALSAAHSDRPVRLDRAVLRGSDLSNDFTFSGCRLFYADLSNTDLRGADLSHADLWGVDLSNAILRGTDLTGALLVDGELNGSQLMTADLRGAVLGRANLRDAEMNLADLRDANLMHADLRGANLANVDFRKANLGDTELCNAKFGSADLRNAELTESRLSDSIFRWADMRNADLERADFSRANLFDVDLTGARLYGAVLSDVQLNTDTQFGDHYTGDADPDPDKAAWTLRQLERLFRENALPEQAREAYLDRKDLRRRQYWRQAFVPGPIRWVVAGGKAGWRGLRRGAGRWLKARINGSAGADEGDDGEAEEVAEAADRESAAATDDDADDEGDEGATDAARADLTSWERLVATGKWARAAGAGVTARYAASPWRVVGVSLVVIGASTVAYKLFGPLVRPPGPDDPVRIGGDLVGAVSVTPPGWLAEWLTSLYFSVVTFTTLGYGDLRPASGVARVVATVESFVGALLMALLVFVLGRRATW